MRRRLPRLSMLAATGALSVATLTACGGGSGGGGNQPVPSDPKGELTVGIQNLSHEGTVTTTLKLEATPSTLQELAASSGSQLDDQTAQAISTAQVVIETQRSGSDSNVDVKVQDGGKTLLELRGVAGSLYAQGDVQGILTLFHKESTFAQLQQQVTQAPTFVQAFVQGQWISVDKQTLQALASQFGAAGATASPQAGNQLLNKFSELVSKDITVTKVGTDGDGDHLKLTGDQKQLAADLQQAIVSTLPGGAALGSRLDSSQVESKQLTVDAWVKSGELSKLSLDLAQFAPPGDVPAGTTLPISLTFSNSGDSIDAPAGAAAVDLSQLGQLFGGLAGGGASLGSSGGGAS